MTVLAQSIHHEILKHGSISFARFMELALYSPGVGYYESSTDQIGRKGDFFTSVSTGNLFGELLCEQFVQWLSNMDRIPLQITECGAHDGRLAADILECLKTSHPAKLDRVEYWIVEPSSVREARQRTLLARFQDKVRWFRTIEELAGIGIHGVCFSNELLDAMPIHRLGWDARQREWFEWRVTVSGNDLVWCRGAVEEHARGELIPDLPRALLEVLPHDYTIEVSPAACAWWSQAARALLRGWLVTIDYGFAGDEQFRPERTRGTLRAYHRHQVADDVLNRPGDQDITAHVNFGDLIQAGEQEGLKTEELTDQPRFLSRMLLNLIERSNPRGVLDTDKVRQFQTLTHPEHLGHAFKVLVQSRL